MSASIKLDRHTMGWRILRVNLVMAAAAACGFGKAEGAAGKRIGIAEHPRRTVLIVFADAKFGL